jgi:2-polyprenyl-3-methyl-5-hydroxy-6-metoxy-1,4-benzoquinol methylase
LIWADARIDQDVVGRHFEGAYKDETYFQESRKAIFDHLAAVIDKHAGTGARVLDVGGAKGHLMHRVLLRRPDLHVTVHDISLSATTWAEDNFGFDTICGNVQALEAHEQTYDVIVLSDVLYYEPDLLLLWSTLQRLLAPGGSIVIRVPNKLAPIRIGQLMVNAFSTARARILQDRVLYFNPEHIYIFSRRFLENRLRRLGCAEVRALPSPLLSSSIWGIARVLYFRLASALNLVSGRQLVLTPSMVLVGRRSS